MKKIYLCGPINGRTDADCRDWREQVKALWSHGETLDPMRRDYRGRELEPGIAAEIIAGDLEDLHNCDALLAFVDKPSFGTAMEVFYVKHNLKKPVVVIDATGRPLSPWLVYHSDAIVSNVAEAITRLESL